MCKKQVVPAAFVLAINWVGAGSEVCWLWKSCKYWSALLTLVDLRRGGIEGCLGVVLMGGEETKMGGEAVGEGEIKSL